jgi:hypothetical protein
MPTVPVSALQEAIRNLHGCVSTLAAVVQVKENFDGKQVWEREVSVFDLTGHPTAKRAYAWAEEGSEGRVRFVAVLHAGKVNSPSAAVRASIASERQPNGRESDDP